MYNDPRTCGTALFSDGYANGIIGSVLTEIYGKDALASHNYSRTLNSLGFVGTIVGMLIFGYLSDKVGRKFGMMVATGLVAIFSLLSAGSSGMHDNVDGLLGMLTACRFFLGIGVGAEYPCGSGIRGKGQHRWLALATILFAQPGITTLTLVEPPRYRKDSMKYTTIPYLLIARRYGVRLTAIAVVWFLYDLVVYFRLYSSTVLMSNTNNHNSLTRGSSAISVVFGWTVVINLCYIPGTIGGAFLLDYVSPKHTLIMGLLAQAVVGFIVAGLYKQLTDHIGVFAGQFFAVAAAIGKVGAFAGTWVFGGSDTARGNTGPFWIGSCCAIISAIITFVFIKPVDQDGMVEEDKLFREYLESKGYDTSAMGIGEKGDELIPREGKPETSPAQYSRTLEP
ncbi:major facilitator superfamily domain-containing protein [Infundibulicybe gibba]|nr:major facilitator superfamily domain-containing protein [Infundibulicybe gibba]